MSFGKAYQVDYAVSATVRGHKTVSGREYGPWFTLVSSAAQEEGCYIPAMSIHVCGRAELQAIKEAVDYALSTVDE